MPLFSVDYAYTHLASCREIGNCDIKVVQKVVVPKTEVRNSQNSMTHKDIHQRSTSHQEDLLGDRKMRTTDSKRSDRLSLETFAIRTRLLKQRYKFSDSSVFWLDIVIA